MDTTATGELGHEVEVVTDDGFDHRAECSCGWASERLVDDVAAVLAGAEHAEFEVGPPDALDGLMGHLLDIQDDLSRVVEWLAERWSSDLPVPVPAMPESGRRALDLTVCCRDAAELNRVADVLGAELRRYDGEDSAYRCARRRFGTILIEAWRAEP
jgi:hypothetical protein